MENANRYLATIESLMSENSRLTKELQDSLQGKLPERIVSQDIADLCFSKIAHVLGPSASGTLLDEVNTLCNEFLKIVDEHSVVSYKLKKYVKENEEIEKALMGEDVEDGHAATVGKVVKLRAVLEVTKARLDRFVVGNSEIADLRREVAAFLNGGNNA